MMKVTLDMENVDSFDSEYVVIFGMLYASRMLINWSSEQGRQVF